MKQAAGSGEGSAAEEVLTHGLRAARCLGLCDTSARPVELGEGWGRTMERAVRECGGSMARWERRGRSEWTQDTSSG